MQVLHTLNSSLYPDIEPFPTTWSGPDDCVVLVQCLLYASLAISLFGAFVATLGKEWLDRVARNKGRAAAEKSWDRQRRSRGMEQWNFYFIMEVRFRRDEGIRTFGFRLGLVRVKRDTGPTAGASTR